MSATIGIAHAESSVTLYGIFDSGIRYVSSIDGQHSKTYLASGGMNPDEFGIRGTEDLGGGLRAVFDLENQFSGADGSAPPVSTSPQLFGRQAYVGLESDKYGALTFGHQYNAMNILFDYAPIWVDGASPFYVAGDNLALGYRISSSAVYKKSFGPVAIQLDYGFGGQPGSLAKGATAGGSVAYNFESAEIAGAYDQYKSADGASLAQVWTAGGRYAIGKTTLFAGYMHNSNSGQNNQRRDLYFGGAQYSVTPAFLLSGGYFYYQQSSCSGTCTAGQTVASGNGGGQIFGISGGGGAGHANILALSANYFLSKRTALYAEVDTYRLRGGAARDQVYYWTGTDNPNMTSLNQYTALIGLTHHF
ncbi:porin [Paraburkholderia sabiae]|uniref:Porin n=1 Tax=Paraburkholderia sabiae TaxID=273251 RepID=A0ABU9QKD1_9BURK|nr:porin [Paraburkholderia sabiae]WJZ76480.1 porin [Paraburkholderia sabiae]